MAARKLCSSLFALSVAAAACNGTTGDNLIQFTPYASGVAAAQEPFDAFGWRIQLTSASMYIGAVYFDESPPQTSFDSTECNVSDTFAAQVPGGVQVNLLSTTPQEFSVYGSGSADTALSWDLWFANGDINQANTLPTATLTGYATNLSDPKQVISFGAIVNINPGESGAGARGMPASNPALPGAYPICKQRIVQIVGIDLQFGQTNSNVNGALLVTVDPRAWFLAAGQIDFSQLSAYNDPDACQLGTDDWNDSYESWGPCSSSMTCPAGQTCNQYTQNGVPVCVLPCNMNVSEDMSCPDGFTCNPIDGNCIAAVCIPDSNWTGCAPAASGGDAGASTTCPVSPTSSQAGENLYLGILEGGGAAYKAYYSASGTLPSP